MKKLVILAALCSVAAVSSAQQAAEGEAPMATGLVATPSLQLSQAFGRIAFGTLKVTNMGPGYATNLHVSQSPGPYAADGAALILAQPGHGDTCTGATLAVGGTCSVNVQAWTTCPAAHTDNWTVFYRADSGQATSTPVKVISKGGICD